MNVQAHDAKRAVQNVGILIVASIFSKGLLFVWQIVLGNWLGVTDYGIYNTVFALIAVAMPIASFSMGLILIRQIARQPEKSAQYWASALTIQTALAGLAYVGAVGGGTLAGYSDLIIAYTAIASLSILIDIFGSQANDVLLAHERMGIASIVDISHIVARVGLSALALLLGWGLLGVYGATILSGIGRSIVLWGIHWRSGLRPVFPLERDITRRLVVDSAPLALTSLLVLAYQHADKLMTTAIIGETNTGYLAPAFVINFGIIEIFGTSVLVAMYPLMSRYYGDGTNALFGFIVQILTRFTLIFVLPVALVLSIYADAIIALIFNPEFAPTGGVLRILIWYTCLTMVGNTMSKALLIQNRQRLLMLIRVSGLLVNIALNAWFLSQWRDPRGAALASVIAEVLILSLLFWHFKTEGWHLRQLLDRTWRVVGVGLVVALVMLILMDAPFFLGAFIGILLYIALIAYLPILQSEDWDLLYRLVALTPFGNVVRRYWRRDVNLKWEA